MTTTALIVAGPAQTAAAGQQAAAGPMRREVIGLPFSLADVGWVFLAAVVLLVVTAALQALARRQARAPRRAVRERTSTQS